MENVFNNHADSRDMLVAKGNYYRVVTNKFRNRFLYGGH